MSLDSFFATLTSTRMVIPDADNPSLYQAGDASFNESNVYQWKGPEVTSTIGDPIPIVYGRHRVAGTMINAYLEIGEQETLNMLLALAEGPINSVSNVEVNGTPIEEFYGVNANDPYGENAEVTFRSGQKDQTLIQEFGDIHSVNNIDVDLNQNEEYIYVTNLSQMMAFTVEIEASELYQLDSNNNKISWYFACKIEYRVHGDSTWIFAGFAEVNKLSETAFRRFFKSDYLPPNQYDIRITKVSEDEGGETKFGKITLNSIDEILNLEFQYPYVACLGVRLVATDKISKNTPNITAEIEGRLINIPDVQYGGEAVDWEDYYYDSSTSQFKLLENDAVCTWDGVSYIDAFSANPAWCLKDLFTNSRYGLGQFIDASNIDDPSFLQAALYCEEGVENLYGKKEKRTRLDVVLDKSFHAPDIINHIASTFRGFITYDNGKIRLVIEKAESYSQMFNMGNIVANSFAMRYHSAKEIPNVLILEYTNKDKNYARDRIEVADEESISAGNPIRQESIAFFGCTRPSQLIREGQVLLNKLKANSRSISFLAYTDALNCQAGDIILFQHDVPQWSFGGRVKAGSTTTKVVLGKEITLAPATTYKIVVRSNVDDTLEERTISDSSGTYTEVNVTIPFSFTPQNYDLWVCGEEDNLGVQYRIIGLTKMNTGFTSISAVQYTPEAYADGSVVMPDDNLSYISLDIPDVYDLNVKEQVTRENDGTIRDTVLVSFTRPPNSLRWIKKAVKWHIYYSDNEGKNWIYSGVTETEEYVINEPLAIGRTYTVAVVSEADTGDKNAPDTSPQDSVTIEGWKGVASDVTGFYYNFTNTIEFYWDKNPDPDHFGYEIRTEDADWGQDDPELIWRGNAEKFVLETPNDRQGITYYIKAYNTSYNFSANATSISPVNLAPSAPVLSYTLLFQKIFLLWQDIYDVDIQHYEVWRNDNSNWIGIEQGNEMRVGVVGGTSSTQILPYEETFFRIRAVDSLGAGAWSNSISVSRILLASDDLNDDIIGAEHIQAGSITAGKILANSIQSEHFAAKNVLAEHIDVAELSALSAHLGSIESGTIVGAVIKTSNFPYHTQINSAGLFSYDNDGNLRTKLVRGELCLVDPVCSECYSYLDSGALKFHHPYGTVPYVKRIESGCGLTGTSVYLEQWYEKPELTLGVNRLSSFKSANSESDQEWTVYHDNLRQYNNGGGDFGWAFDIHSRLVISGGIRPECIWLCNFDQTVQTTTNTCQVLVKNLFQLYTHGTAPANYCYGVECYEIRYKETGCGVWCSNQYLYTQPHSSIDMMTCTQVMCNTLSLPSGQWDISTHRVNINWYDSGIPSGYVCCLWCCYQYTVDCSYWYYEHYEEQQSAASIGLLYVIVFQGVPSRTASSSFPGPPAGEVYCSRVTGSVYAYTWWPTSNVYWPGGSVSNGADYSGGFSQTSGGYIGSVGVGVSASGDGNNRAALCYLSNIKNRVYYKVCTKCCILNCVWCCFQYEEYCGAPETCTYEKLYSTQDTTDEEIVLDGAGTVNYLAIAYA